MKKFLIVLLGLLLLPLVVDAEGYKVIYGAGAKVNMYSTGEKETFPIQAIGLSIPSETKGQFGFLIPDETYIIETYGRVKKEDTHVGVYETKLKGLWYFTKDSLSSSPWNPFFIASGNLEVENGEGAETKFSSDLGLGTGYSINNKWGFWTGHTLKIGDELNYEGAAGVYFTLY